jgi:hypothetical protein
MNNLLVFDEPQLAFASGGKLEHPRDGLALFGPADAKDAEKPKALRYGIVGTKNSVAVFREFAKAIARPVLTESHLDDVLWPHFPGFEEAFHAELPAEPAWVGELDTLVLKDAATERDDHKRVFGVASLFLDRLKAAKKPGQPFDFFVVVVPDFIFMTCRAVSRFQGGHGSRIGKREQRLRAQILDFFETYETQQYSWSLDFRYQIKRRVMDLDIPIQIVRESTLRLAAAERRGGGRQLTPLSDRAWNLSTALYYKSGGVPWKLGDVRESVCHVGISFKETGTVDTTLSAAQMFLDDGNGQVIRGADGNWAAARMGEYHLNKDGAQRLLSNVLAAHKFFHLKKLTEVVLHSRWALNEEELEGYQAACPKEVKLVVVRVTPERLGLRLYRTGTQPVLRGTFWQVSPKRGFLWASGFKPRLRAYPGSGIPQPLCLDIQHGDADILQVAKDIFALTKLNYNACNLGENQPVTTHFSSLVGEILASNPTVGSHKPDFKYYI